MTAMLTLDPIRRAMFGIVATGLIAAPALAQTAPERGVFVTQIGDAPRADITQRHADSLALIVQDGAGNTLDLEQEGSAPHRAQIAQDGDDNMVIARQHGDGTTNLTLVQEGNANMAVLQQREESSAAQTAAAILQRGDGNSIILEQDGSDNSASLNQVGDSNTMTASQFNSGNRLEWNQIGNGLPNMLVEQSGNGTIQITQSNSGAAFAPPPSAPGG